MSSVRTLPLVVALAAVLAAATAACSAASASPSTSTPPGPTDAVYVHLRESRPVASPDIAQTGWPFPGDPAAFGTPFTSTLDAWPEGRCALVDAAIVDSALATLPPGLLAPLDDAPGWRIGTLGWAARGMDVLLAVQEVAPEEADRTCERLWMAQFDPAGG